MIEFSHERYIEDVLSGEQVACRWVRQACERHVRDLETGAERAERAARRTLSKVQRKVGFLPRGGSR